MSTRYMNSRIALFAYDKVRRGLNCHAIQAKINADIEGVEKWLPPHEVGPVTTAKQNF